MGWIFEHRFDLFPWTELWQEPRWRWPGER